MNPLKRKYDDASPEDNRKIIVAVDFGTTYSGLAWVQTGKPEIQSSIIQWPNTACGGLEGITSDKVPTEIRYNGHDLFWGFQINDSDLRYRLFKLDLDPSQCRRFSLAKAFPDSFATLTASDMTVEQIVTDYLTCLRKHSDQILRNKLPQSALKSVSVEFVITVPAVWSDSAQAKTRRCAEDAGMGTGSTLQMISEPEAAAIYALDAMDRHDIKVGETFVLLDAGGGTVDLISYKIEALYPILKIKEASPGTGSLCGSSFLNRIFQKFLKDKLSNLEGWEEDILEEATQRFELMIKRCFQGNTDEDFQIPVAGLADDSERGIRRGKFRMTGAEVKSIFDPEVVDMVLKQIEDTKEVVKAVLMVGGFGQSAYLRDCIRAAVGEVEVMQPPNGLVIYFVLCAASADSIRWTAVVRGALMNGLASTSPKFAKVKVTSRSARKHYGIIIRVKYHASKHEHSRRIWNSFYGYFQVDIVQWFIHKGAYVEENKPVRLAYTQKRSISRGRPSTLTNTIHVFGDHNDKGAPLYPNDDVSELVTLTADLHRVPVKNFPKVKGADRKLYYDIQFSIEITHFSAYTTYELIHNNINYGAVKAEYV